ncbi:MAG TPA: Nramp family divalent metal transporter [Gemmatimonadaceae bacterium]|nr:Nramp family divalent metal transporter [Gemmatimonadaceae bacterium]
MTAPARKERRQRRRPPHPPAKPRERGIGPFLRDLGPGLVTGAADDDPSGISTYSQAGAAFGFGLLWTALLSFPLMVAVQLMCARLGLVTRRGLASVLRKYYPPWLLWFACCLLVVSNTINIAADLSGMGAGAELLTHVNHVWFVPVFAVVILLFLMFGSYAMLLRIFKWLTLVLFAYVAAAFLAKPSWGAVARGTFLPQISFTKEYLFTFVAIFGTTISPYLFFWQAAQEVEADEALNHELGDRPRRSLERELRSARTDVSAGMIVSNVVMYFIILTAGATLHAHGNTQVQTAAEAAKALEPVAGKLAALLFTLGIVGTGLLGVPVLAGSAAYAVAEAAAWRRGMDAQPHQARNFYLVIAASMLIGVALSFSPIDPIRLLLWSAVINGILAPPLIIIVLVICNNPKVMGSFRNGLTINVFGSIAAAIMSGSALALIASWIGLIK